MPPARTTFWALAARVYGLVSWPVNTFLNCTMPALVNNRVGSLRGTSGLLGTTWCSRSAKKSRKPARMSLLETMAVWRMALDATVT